jgi:hypothetical protein
MKWRLKRYDLNDAGDIVNAADAGLWVDLVLPPSGGASDLWGDYTCNDLTNSADSGAMLRASLPPTGLAVCNGPYW